jgi:hypothetical protein
MRPPSRRARSASTCSVSAACSGFDASIDDSRHGTCPP